jgi:hypothetical protein
MGREALPVFDKGPFGSRQYTITALRAIIFMSEIKGDSRISRVQENEFNRTRRDKAVPIRDRTIRRSKVPAGNYIRIAERKRFPDCKWDLEISQGGSHGRRVILDPSFGGMRLLSDVPVAHSERRTGFFVRRCDRLVDEQNFHTFNVGFPVANIDESSKASAVAVSIGQSIINGMLV